MSALPDGPGRLRRPGFPRLVRVHGRSMVPTLVDGDLLVTTLPGRVRPGDLVVVDLPGGRPRAVKRLVRREPDGWWVERDSPVEGIDSWSVGAIPLDGLHARVVLRLWPKPRWLGRSRLGGWP